MTEPNDLLLSVVVPVWRGSPRRGRAVVGLAESLSRTVEHAYELIVVENGRAAPDDLAGARRVSLPENVGVAKGWNAGARVAAGRHIAFVNDDVIVGDGCMDRLIGVLEEDPGVGVVGPRGARWDAKLGAHVAYVDGDGRVDADMVSGFLFVTRREAWEAVGGFDERYTPCSYEEVDYCFAVRAGGWRCEAVSPLEYEHDWGISRARPFTRIRFEGRSESIKSINRRNHALLVEKWGD